MAAEIVSSPTKHTVNVIEALGIGQATREYLQNNLKINIFLEFKAKAAQPSRDNEKLILCTATGFRLVVGGAGQFT